MKFLYLECPDCEWSCVIAESETELGLCCPVCAEDNGRDVYLRGREAKPEDKVEGRDARKEDAACRNH